MNPIGKPLNTSKPLSSPSTTKTTFEKITSIFNNTFLCKETPDEIKLHEENRQFGNSKKMKDLQEKVVLDSSYVERKDNKLIYSVTNINKLVTTPILDDKKHILGFTTLLKKNYHVEEANKTTPPEETVLGGISYGIDHTDNSLRIYGLEHPNTPLDPAKNSVPNILLTQIESVAKSYGIKKIKTTCCPPGAHQLAETHFWEPMGYKSDPQYPGFLTKTI